MKKSTLRNYAALIAGTGAAVKPGQEVVIQAELDQPEFVKMVAEECYKLGAANVEVQWSYQPMVPVNVKYRSEEILGKVEKWEKERFLHRLDVLPAMIYLLSEDPDGMSGIDHEKYAAAIQSRSKVIKPIRDKMENRYQWCIAAVPGKAWAKKVFPEMRVGAAMKALWDAILYTSRADGPDPSAAWAEHNKNLAARCDYLNSIGAKSLEYSAGNGTSLSVELIPGAKFMAGGEYTTAGNYFNPNIPSEEVFITPKRGAAEGIVYSSKPLSYQSQLIDNFSVTFEGGKVKSVSAEKNQALLETLVAMDEGASYLGECALVPVESPINQSGILFYNTLFDENAACHLALGRGFSNCLPGFENMSQDELLAAGINDSMIHEDFMIGTDDLSIDALCADGVRREIFRNGTWAFEV